MSRVLSFFALYILLQPAILQAQDVSNFTQFFINPYTLNPSYAGIDGRNALSFAFRKQWATIDGGPTISNFSFHGPTNFGLIYGLNVINDKRGILNNSGAMVSVGYALQFDKHSALRFGVSFGGAANTIDLDKLNDEALNDPALQDILDKNTSLLGNAGLSLHIKSFHFGASLPNIFAPNYVSKDAFTVTEVAPFEAIIVHASNRFYFAKDKHVFEPYAVYRMNTGLPSQFEVAGILHLNHVLWFGGSFKQDFGISAMGGIKMQNFLLLGGSYSLKNSGVNELNSPSFEVQVSYLFGAKRKDKLAYSFVNTVKEKEKKKLPPPARPQQTAPIVAKTNPPATQTQQPAQKPVVTPPVQQPTQQPVVQQPTLPAQTPPQETKPVEKPPVVVQQTPPIQQPQRPVQQPPVQQQTTTPPVVQQTPPTQQPVQQPTTTPPTQPARRHDGGPRLKSEVFSIDIPTYDTARHEEEARLSRLEEHASDPDEHHGDDPDSHPHGERHEYVKRGSHREELKLGDYVIAGVFKTSTGADQFADGLVKLGFKADYGFSTEKNLWYVYIVMANNINTAKAERDNFRKMKIFRDAWLLTVYQ